MTVWIAPRSFPNVQEFNEAAVLGGVLVDPKQMHACVEWLPGEEAFTREENRTVYSVFLDLYRQGLPVDDCVVLVNEIAKKHGIAGSADYLMGLHSNGGVGANVEHYVKLILEAHLKRVMRAQLREAADRGNKPEFSVKEIASHVAAQMETISRAVEIERADRMDMLTEDAAESLRNMSKHRGLDGIATGITSLDGILCGMKPGVIILAARPSVGKSALSLQIAQHAAIRQLKRVLFFSLEMSKESLVKRAIMSTGAIDSERLKSGFLARQEEGKIAGAVTAMKGASLYLASPAKLTPLTLRGLIQRHKMQHGGIDLVVVDYLGLMLDDTKSKDRQEEISRISRAIKVMSGEIGVPFLVLCQLNRQAEQGRPLLSHLRESGSIEQDADVVIFLSRDDATKSKDTDQLVVCDVAKQRDGITKWVPLLFQRNIQRFKDPSEPQEPERSSHYQTAAVEDDYEDDEAPF